MASKKKNFFNHRKKYSLGKRIICFSSNFDLNLIFRRFVPCSVFCAILTHVGLLPVPVFAGNESLEKMKITASVGIQYLDYKEQLTDNSLESFADVSNIAIRVAGVRKWRNLFVGIDGLVPLVTGDNKEEWLIDAAPGQTNSLEYGITQFAAFIGYPFNPMFSPYLGSRSTWSEQIRSDFRNHDGFLLTYNEITEKVTAHFISFGLRGQFPVSEKWHAAYGAEYSMPYYSKVENSGLPDWKAKDMNGYLWSVIGELSYSYRNNVSMGLFLCAGRQHWEGTGWQNYSGGQVKWPENDTRFASLFLNMDLSF